MFPLWTHWSHQSRLQSQNSLHWRTPKVCAQREKCWKLRRRRNGDLTKMWLWGPSIWSFEVLSEHGDEVDGDESTYETTEMMPPLPPDSRFQRSETFCGKFRNLAMKITEMKRIHSLIVGMGSKNSSTLCNKWILGARNAPKSVPDVKGCLSANFLSVLRARSWECTNICQSKRHSMTSPVKEKTDRATTPMLESGGLTRWT